MNWGHRRDPIKKVAHRELADELVAGLWVAA